MTRFTRSTLTLALVAALAACSRQKPAAPATGHVHQHAFVNGGFEDGTLSGWTVTTALVPGAGMTYPPTSIADLGLSGSSNNFTSVKTSATPDSLIPAGLTSSSTLRLPRYGTGTAVVNEQGASNNSNTLAQTMTTSNADVDPADNKVHVRFAIAPVLQNPGHANNAQPYFWVQLRNVTKNSMLFQTFNFANQPGVPWKTDTNGVLYTDWQAFDISPGPAQLAVGDQVEIKVVASGCAAGGHWGEVYVDAFGASLPGLQVSATAPQQVNTGSQLTYTFNYKNGGTAAATNTIVVENLPTYTTFASVSAPGATCTTPPVGGTGAVSCNVGTVNPAASGSFTVTVNVTGAAGNTISNGNYDVYADGVAALIGPLVTTSITSGVQYADVGVTLSDGVAAVGWGTSTTYTLVVANAGPAAADGTTLSDPLPANVSSWSWTCSASGGAACPTASGSGSLAQTIATFPSGGSLTYAIVASVAAGSGAGSLVHQAAAATPGGVSDNNGSNNVGVDTDAIGTLDALTLQKTGAGQGSVISSPAAISCGAACPSQTASFLDGTSVVLTASAGPGWVFNGWSGGGCTGAQATCTVTLSGPTTVQANFGPVQWNVVGSAPGGNGTVSCASPVDNGTPGTCTITPSGLSYLSALTDNGANVLASVSGGAYGIASVTGNHAVVGTFSPSVSVTTVSPSPASTVFGQAVTLTAAVAGVSPAGTPGGTVTIRDGGVAISGCGNLTMAAGSASCVTSALAVGTHTLSAVYGGDATWNGSTSGNASLVVGKASSAVALADVPAGSSLNGVPVTLTATASAVAPGAGTPTGTVAFTDDGAAISGCGAVALSAGVASCTTAAVLGAGTHTFGAAYGGSVAFNASSGTRAHDVLRVAPAVALVSGASPTLYGEPVTYAVTVSHALGSPTGSVTVLDGAAVVCGPVALTAGAASCASAALTVGTHALTAQYGGDSGFLPAASPPWSQLVVRATASSSVTGDLTHAVYGQPVTFTAVVDPDAPSTITPAGTVTFRDGSTVICANVALVAGQASCVAPALPVAWHAISARYNGSTGYAPSTSYSFVVQVDPASTAVALAPAPAGSVFGQAVAHSVSVSSSAPGSGTPTGTVTVLDGGAPIAGCVGLPLAGGAASCSTATLAVGTHQLSASYGGETRYQASASTPQAYVVARAPTALALASPSATVFGETATLTAAVTVPSPGAGAPAGTVTFLDGAATLGTVALDGSGHASFSTAALAVGDHAITAVYAGDGSFLGSTAAAVTQAVQRASSATVLAASPPALVNGQPVTLTATVSATPPGAGVPGGTVAFYLGGVVIPGCESVPVVAGVASCPVAALPPGNDVLRAVSSGDGSFQGSTSASTDVLVSPASVTLVAASGPSPAVFGETVTVTVAASPVAPSLATPGGTVQLLDGGVAFASATLDGAGHASFPVSSLAAGTHALSVALLASASFNAVVSAPVQQVVIPADTTLLLVSGNPSSTFGTSVTFTATVAAVAPGAGVPGGTVTFSEGATVLGSATLDGAGVATFGTAALRAGAHTLQAAYGGSASFNGSSGSAAQAVSRATTAVALAAAPNPSVFGQAVTWTAQVTAAAPTAAGTVTFTAGSRTLGQAALDGSGVATVTSSVLPVGSNPVVASYGGGDDWLPADSAPAAQDVLKASVTLALAAAPQPTVFGQPVTLTVAVAAIPPGAGLPTGTIAFRDGGATIGTATVQADGSAVLVIDSLAAGAHTISAAYGGDASFNGASTAVDLGHPVNRAPVTVALASSKEPSRFGEGVTWTVTVTAAPPGAGTPSGTVALSDGGSPLATVTLTGGVGAFTSAALAVGSHTLTADYAGDSSFLPGGTSTTQDVQKADAAVALVSAPTPSRFGQSVTITATVSAVAPGAGTPSGTVTFKDGGTTLGTGTLSGGVATFATSSFAVGSHALTADYAGDGSFNTASGSATQVVQKADAAVALASAPTPSRSGQSVTITATVSAVAPGAGTPSGTVTFKDGGTTLGTGTLSVGVATFTTSALAVGSHALTADYAGDGSFNTASGSATQVVQKADSTLALASAPTPSRSGQSVTITATVSAVAPGTGTPSGTVTFKDGGVAIGSGTLSGGVATFTTSALAVGSHALTADYGGDASFNTSSGSATQVVQKADSSVALASAPTPSRFGQSVTITATVSAVAPGAGTPSGTVTFKDGGVAIGSGTLSGGVATFTTSALAVGSHALTADYAGDASFNTSSGSASQVVQKADSALALASAPTPSSAGQSVTVTATLSAVAPGAGTATGTITFKDGGVAVGSGTLSGGVATFTTSALAVGSHALTADYAGDASFNASAGATTQVVQQAQSAVALAAAPSPAPYGQTVVLTATVTAVAPGSGTPTGTVTFREGSTVLGSGALAAGVATFSVTRPAPGPHAYAADYGGSATFLPSSGAGSLTVAKAATTLALATSRATSRAGQPVTLTATVTSQHATPDGSVTFQDGATTLGTGTLDAGGVARLVVRSLRKGPHPVTASYGGSDRFLGSDGSLAGGVTVENSPPVAGAGTALAFGPAAASLATVDTTGGALDTASATLELWVRPGWTAPGDVTGTPGLVRLRGAGADRLALGVSPDRKAVVVTVHTTSTAVPAALDDGRWHHLALQAGDRALTLLVDGLAAGAVDGPLDAATASTSLELGAGFLGDLDELRLWNGVVSASALADAARRPLQGGEADLLGYWRMDDGDGLSLLDAGPSHLDAVVTFAGTGGPPPGAVFTASGAWRQRETWQERPMAPADTGYDPDGDPLTLTVTQAPAHGSATADADHLQVGYQPAEGYLGADQLAFTLDDGTTQASYPLDVEVKRILVCQVNADCGGGDLCVAGACVAPTQVTARSGGGCSSGGGEAVLPWALLVLGLLGRPRNHRPAPRAARREEE